MSKDDETRRGAKRPEDWATEEKLRAVMEASSLSYVVPLLLTVRTRCLAAPQRRQGGALAAGRENALSGFTARPSRASGEDRKRIKELERELTRKDKALAETAALLVLQGKMEALWAAEDDPIRQSSEEPSSRASRKRKKQGHN